MYLKEAEGPAPRPHADSQAKVTISSAFFLSKAAQVYLSESKHVQLDY
jgi:hypothetical protein